MALSIRLLFKQLQQAPAPMAVLLFAHGLETLSIQPETPLQEQQLQRLLQDYQRHLVGVYDASVSFAALTDDIETTREEIFFDSCQETQ
jgi:hypothetical protein